MDFKEAVKLAKAGDEKGFNFLYEETCSSKYYLALHYMKNEEAAKDVLQEAYMKAFSKLDTLEKPEAFSGWLGTIVGNTAKNMLQKKNPMLFSDIAKDNEGESFEYQIEDDRPEIQPEVVYTRQETQKLVHELIETLSDEQRMCILMYHIEGVPIREIAAALDCSENTVKSRLNYGRKKLRDKAEELQKKGYKLYGIAPLPLFLYLLRTEKDYLLADGTLAVTGAKNFSGTGAKAASKAGKRGFLHTAAGKAAAAAVGIGIAGGAVFYGVSQINVKDHRAEVNMKQKQKKDDKTKKSGLSVKEIYIRVLGAVKKQEPGYTFSDTGASSGKYQYFLCDMNGDGIQELVVGAEFEDRNKTAEANECRVYSCEKTEAGYKLKKISGNIVAETLYIAADGGGLYRQDFYRGTGKILIYRITLQDGALAAKKEPEYEFTMGDAGYEAFNNTNISPEWTDVSDQKGLNSLGEGEK